MARFLLLPSYRRFPSDEEFHRDLQTRDFYNFRSRSYWLRRMENHGRKERVVVDDQRRRLFTRETPCLFDYFSITRAEMQAASQVRVKSFKSSAGKRERVHRIGMFASGV